MQLLAAAQEDQEHLKIETTSSGTAKELLKKTDNGAQNTDSEAKISWGSTGAANPKGYCQHATRLDDPNHLTHNSNGKDFTIT